MYRRLLAGAPDGSVTIACVGLLTAVAALLVTQGDEISPLSGVELVRRKVKRMISMGELPREGEKCVSFNYFMDLPATEIFFETCPVPVWVSPEGTHVITGAHFTDTLSPEHPLRIAYERFNGIRQGRSRWNLVAALQAMRPENACLRLESIGMVRSESASQRIWREKDGWRQDQMLLSQISDEEMAKRLNRMLG